MATGVEPRVIDGARSPSDLERANAEEIRRAEERAILAASQPVKTPRKRKEYDYPTRFVSASSNYLLMLDKTQELADGTIKHNKFQLRFEHGQLDITTKTYPVSTRIVSELVTSSSGYGLGRSFWDADEAEAALAAAEKRRVLDSARRAKADPDLRAALIAELQAEDFDLTEK